MSFGLEKGDGWDILKGIFKKIKAKGLDENDANIFESTQSGVIPIPYAIALEKKYIEDFKDIIVKNVLMPQMLTDGTFYIPIYDTDFSYKGNIVTKADLIHFFLINDKLNIIVQKTRTASIADMYISNNGKKFYK